MTRTGDREIGVVSGRVGIYEFGEGINSTVQWHVMYMLQLFRKFKL